MTDYFSKHLLSHSSLATSDGQTLTTSLNEFIKDHNPLDQWLRNLNIPFEDDASGGLILQSLTHTSFAHENKAWTLGQNERLEFLGDAILDEELSRRLFLNFPDLKEGELSRLRSSLVNEESLALWCDLVGLTPFILIGKGELVKGHVEVAIKADAFEAFLGAVSLIERTLVTTLIDKWIKVFDESQRDLPFFDLRRLELFDPKTKLQEKTLALYKVVPTYEFKEKDSLFICELYLSVEGEKTRLMAKGTGPSKKKAALIAAKKALLEESYK